MTAAETILLLASAPAAAATGYLVLLSLASRRLPARPVSAPPRVRFDVVVPAHDEDGTITSTVESLLEMDYPHELFRVVVVADNCSDDTGARALVAGASVLVRDDPSRKGKGYALAHAFEHVLAEGTADAVVVVDADTIASPDLLRALAARLDAGAFAAQADYTVRNPDASWRTLLMAVALGAVHTLRSLARERLGLSCGLRGNGMCFTTSLLRAVPHDALSVVEDLEYGIRLGEAGYRVHYAHDAHVYGEMPSGERAGGTQRRRWEAGRWRMARAHAARLLLRWIWTRDRIVLDLAVDLLVPPLATLAVMIALGLTATLVLSWQMGQLATVAWIWIGSALGIVVYGVRGWQLSGTGVRGLLALRFVPRYVAWKLALLVRPRAGEGTEWVRTAREGEAR